MDARFLGASGLRPSHRPPVEDDFALIRLVFVFADVEEIGAGDIADLNKSTLVGYLPVGSGEPTRGGYP
jgi:hypothetical protein